MTILLLWAFGTQFEIVLVKFEIKLQYFKTLERVNLMSNLNYGGYSYDTCQSIKSGSDVPELF